jgi:hypothetical protein
MASYFDVAYPANDDSRDQEYGDGHEFIGLEKRPAWRAHG